MDVTAPAIDARSTQAAAILHRIALAWASSGRPCTGGTAIGWEGQGTAPRPGVTRWRTYSNRYGILRRLIRCGWVVDLGAVGEREFPKRYRLQLTAEGETALKAYRDLGVV